MAWRGLHLSEPARLSLSRQQILVEREAVEDVTLPLEDVAWIVLDTPQVTATAALTSACMGAGIPILYCDARHMPCGMALPFHQHWQQAAVAHIQAGASIPLKKRLWQSIIRGKIDNQAAILDRAQAEGGDTMRAMRAHVRSGDPDNVEARAARFYWQRLFTDFRRQDESDLRNAMLNYAYAILRGAVARGIVASGLLPAFGLHHQGQQNAFNLADDVIELFRPLADWHVFELSGRGPRPAEESLSRDARRSLVSVMTDTLVIDGEQLTVLPAVDKTVASLVRALTEKDPDALRLPKV